MSGAVSPTVRSSIAALLPPLPRSLALGGAAVLTLSYLSVLYHVVDVVGAVAPFLVVVLGALGLAAILAPTLPIRTAVAVGVVLLVGGLLMYLGTVPQAYLNLERSLGDTVSLLTGLSVLRMTNVGVWAIGFTPGPVFVSWYFFVRREYAAGALVGGGALAWFVLTGDAGTVVALAGTVGGLAAIGIGDVERLGGTHGQLGTVGALLVAILVVTTSVSVVPGGEARPLLTDPGGSSVEASLLGTGDRVSILGSIRLSPSVRFSVESTAEARWQVGAFDRYTGGGWVRTGESVPYQRALPQPPGPADRVVQTYTAETGISTMPAAWKPRRVGRGAGGTLVTDLGGIEPAGTLSTGDRYTVESAVPRASEARLHRAGTDYPEPITLRYTQLPASTPDRVATLTEQITAEAETPYDTAVAIERYLETEKAYSLDVNRPEGDIADAFIFEMEAGYCTYFATAMVAMLRTQDIPARFVVGYLPGQQVADGQWVVRGYDSHAWVEVYFPRTGWVAFDPTPAGPRQQAEQARQTQARANDEPNVDTNQTSEDDGSGGAFTPNPNATGISDATVPDMTPTSTGSNVTTAAADGAAGDGTVGDAGGSGLPSREETAYGLVLLAGVLVAGQRLGIFGRLYRRFWLRRPVTGSPRERVLEATRRVEYLLGRRHRARMTAETPREYRATLRRLGADEETLRIYDLYERARYAGTVSEAEATEAVGLLRRAVDDSARIARIDR